MVASYALIVPLRLGETARRYVASSGIGRTDLKVGRRDGKLYIPIERSVAPPLPGSTIEMADFEPTRPAGSYKDIIAVPDELRSKLPSSFDIVGDLVVIKIPEALWAQRTDIAQAILEAHSNIRGVFHDEGVAGGHRVRSLQHLAGDDRTRTIHSEYGAKFHVDLATAYFSPRLANEHQRVAQAVKPGETFVDATAGVGPFTIQAALRKVPATFFAIDLNERALELLRENLRLNRIQAPVDVRVGDARDVLPTLAPIHRVAINLPHGGLPILEAAWPRLVAGGSAHYYAIAEESGIAALEQKIIAHLRKTTGLGASVTDTHVVHPYSPKERLVSFDLRRD